MATLSRQPFAPLDGARLQTLTSLKNKQNALPAQPSAGKRKAELLDDSENVDPLLFAKRSKGSSPSSGDLFKPSAFILTSKSLSATNSPATPETTSLLTSPTKTATPRRTLQPKSPVSRLSTNFTKPLTNSAPAGRSPTRGKRSGILNRRRSGPYSRVDPPSFNLGLGTSAGAAPFSLDAALKGTIPSYGIRQAAPAIAPLPAKDNYLDLHQTDMKASWFFDIHEDTPEQDMTNLLQHSTCVLDISSDEESEQRANRERAEGRDKENIPPVDDVSQTSARRSARRNADEMIIEKERVALGEMNTADFFPEGCDETSVIIIPADEDDEQLPQRPQQPLEQKKAERAPIVDELEFSPELRAAEETQADIDEADIDALMFKSEPASTKTAVLEPIEGTGESFELWESSSAKDEAEAATSA
ncbi:hypothetical protein B0I35DRAFT_431347 [Stachybotrys elegans]|uniref:Thymidylate kinase n=1 Tax=Stachybotrys elegans TaxID=80388 RepID=A0A8K0SR42_9HYPO|nr:hypothetical protein B0I35DRAFT_431347 [Stachybotrys elegans]